MVQIPIDIQGLTVWRDLRSNRWTIQAQEQSYTLREWNWGQRHQLARTAALSGRFEPGLFIDGLFELLIEPVPASNRDRYAFVSLHLLGVPEQPPLLSLARAELLLAQAFGWRPTDLADQPVAALDEMVQTLAAQPAYRHLARPQPVDDEGWISIIVRPDPELAPEQAAYAELRIRLQHMLDAVAVWAGLAPAPAQLEAQPQVSDGIPAPNFKTMPREGSARLEPNQALESRAEVAPQEQSLPTGGRPRQNEGPARFWGTARLKAAATRSTPPRSSRAASGSAVSSTALSPGVVRAGQPPDDPAPRVAAGRPGGMPDPQSANPVGRTHHLLPPAGQVEAHPAPPTLPWSDVDPMEGRSSAWPDPITSPWRQEKSWQPLSPILPTAPRRVAISGWRAISGAANGSFAHLAPVEVAMQAASKPAPPQAWDAPPAHESKVVSSALQEGQFEALPALLAGVDTPFENPFALSEFEEQLADALERAAAEAGIDLP